MNKHFGKWCTLKWMLTAVLLREVRIGFLKNVAVEAPYRPCPVGVVKCVGCMELRAAQRVVQCFPVVCYMWAPVLLHGRSGPLLIFRMRLAI